MNDLIGNYGIAITALLVSIAWVFVTAINRSCQHEWVNDGDRVDYVVRSPEGGREDTCRQPVRCVKCGKRTWFRVW